MRQNIYILGIAAVFILSLGTIFKVNHWPAAGILIVTGIILVLTVFLPSALYNHYKSKGNKQIRILYIITWLTCAMVFTSMLFKIMHWPYAGTLLFIAIPFPFVVFLPVWLYTTSRIKNFAINNTIFILFLLMVQAVFSIFLAFNVSKEKIYSTLELSTQLNALNNKTEVLSSSSENTAFMMSADDLLLRIGECRMLLYNKTGITRDDLNNGTSGSRYLDSRNVAAKILLGKGDESPALKLEASVRKFVDELVKLYDFKDEEERIRDIFELKYEDWESADWTERMFTGNYLTWNLVDLDALETSVRVIINSRTIQK